MGRHRIGVPIDAAIGTEGVTVLMPGWVIRKYVGIIHAIPLIGQALCSSMFQSSMCYTSTGYFLKTCLQISKSFNQSFCSE
jgi:hypothetical protein